mmetsp:Transcript_44798/g.120724  ORF Transcript_44798/g.120724 Transcript_44798/m.120724 type:complete len:269 (+) Transcript_44798:327-1133(+)
MERRFQRRRRRRRRERGRPLLSMPPKLRGRWRRQLLPAPRRAEADLEAGEGPRGGDAQGRADHGGRGAPGDAPRGRAQRHRGRAGRLPHAGGAEGPGLVASQAPGGRRRAPRGRGGPGVPLLPPGLRRRHAAPHALGRRAAAPGGAHGLARRDGAVSRRRRRAAVGRPRGGHGGSGRGATGRDAAGRLRLGAGPHAHAPSRGRAEAAPPRGRLRGLRGGHQVLAARPEGRAQRGAGGPRRGPRLPRPRERARVDSRPLTRGGGLLREG